MLILLMLFVIGVEFLCLFYLSSLSYFVYRSRALGIDYSNSLLLGLIFIGISIGVESLVFVLSIVFVDRYGLLSIFLIKLNMLWLITQITLLLSGFFFVLYTFRKVTVITLPTFILPPALASILLFSIAYFSARRMNANKLFNICITMLFSQIMILLGFVLWIPEVVIIGIIARDIIVVHEVKI